MILFAQWFICRNRYKGENGNLVYHGFAGHLLLRDVTHVLRVRGIAGMDSRIKAAMEQCNVTRDQAVAMIGKQDKQSVHWARFLYGVEWPDPSLYDIVLNLERISINGAVETLMHMSELEDFKPTEASLETFEDLLLGSRVWAELTKDPRTHTAHILVKAKKGHITITGDADSEQIVEALTTAATHVEGVKEVTCDVSVGIHLLW